MKDKAQFLREEVLFNKDDKVEMTFESLKQLLTDFANSEQPDLKELDRDKLREQYTQEKGKNPTRTGFLKYAYWLETKLLKPHLKSQVVDWDELRKKMRNELFDIVHKPSAIMAFDFVKSNLEQLHPKAEKQEGVSDEKAFILDFMYYYQDGNAQDKDLYERAIKLNNTQPKKK